MKINPTSTRRIVVIDIRTTVTDQARPSSTVAVGTEVITCIQMIVDDGVQVRAAVFSRASEGDLLRGFWGAVRPGDVFYGYRVVNLLEYLRQRTWALDLVPARDLDLRTVYGHDTFDTAALRSSAGDAQYRSAGALAYLLVLPGNRPGAKRGRVP